MTRVLQFTDVFVLFALFLIFRSAWANKTEHDKPGIGTIAHDDDMTTPAGASTLTAPPPLPMPIPVTGDTPAEVVTRPPARSYKPSAAIAAAAVDEPTQMGAPQPIIANMRMMVDASPPMMQPETKDELFTRIDTNRDGIVDFNDYLKRDRYYLEAVRNEFNQIDNNHDSKLSKQEFDDYIERLEEQRKLSLLRASNYTLHRYDSNNDGALNENELRAYINGSLQRDVSQLSEVFRQFDADKNMKLDLQEFNELDFHFPWEKFPLKESAFMQTQMAMGGAPGATLYGPEATIDATSALMHDVPQ